MGLFLKQSTAVDVQVGPFVDSTDGNTAETGLTITQAEVRLSKNGGNLAQKNEATSLVHDELGYYDCNLDATDTNTLGRLQLMIHESGALPVYHEYMVVTANFYDSICGSDVLQADLTQMGGVAQSATDLKDFADAGYDPATDKVTGVLLCDQTTLVDGVTLCDQTTLVDSVTLCDQTTLVDLATACTTVTTTTDVTNDVGITQAGADKAWGTAARALTDKAGFSLSAAGIDSICDEVMEGTITMRQAMRLLVAVLGGKSSGGGTATLIFRDSGDGTDRVTATVDANGNRTAMTLDFT